MNIRAINLVLALALVGAITAISPGAYAEIYDSRENCALTENSQVSVSFSGVESDPTKLQGKLDAKIAELKTIARDIKAESVFVQSTNYNVSSQNYGGQQSAQYQYNGSVSLTLKPQSKAEEFFVQLSKRGFQASLNVSRYAQNGNCMGLE